MIDEFGWLLVDEYNRKVSTRWTSRAGWPDVLSQCRTMPPPKKSPKCSPSFLKFNKRRYLHTYMYVCEKEVHIQNLLPKVKKIAQMAKIRPIWSPWTRYIFQLCDCARLLQTWTCCQTTVIKLESNSGSVFRNRSQLCVQYDQIFLMIF
jgi:hypothetical protein